MVKPVTIVVDTFTRSFALRLAVKNQIVSLERQIAMINDPKLSEIEQTELDELRIVAKELDDWI